MLHIPYCEFYITHTCNLSCNNCHTFNNLPITGHSKWDENIEKYQRWATKLNIDRISIIGGEPLSNPDLKNWIMGVSALWPNSHIKIYTNGSYFDKWPDLYKLVVDLNQARSQGLIWFVVSIHDKQYLKSFHSWLDLNGIQPKEHYADDARTIEIESHSISPDYDLKKQSEFTIKDHQGVMIQLRDQHSFHTNSLKVNNGQIKLFDSDPDDAIKICRVKTCHHMQDGLLYKCGPIGVLPKIINEFNVDISEQEKTLIRSYVPADSRWSDAELVAFVKDLNDANSIPQCRFCPDSFDYSPVDATSKKIVWQKYHKKKNSQGLTRYK